MKYSANRSPWCDPKLCDHLQQWWQVEGLTAGQIERNLLGLGLTISRNAIIGKVHRMGLVPPASKGRSLKEQCAQRAKVANTGRIRKPRPERERFVILRGKKYNPHRPLEAKMSNKRPDGSKSILLKHAKEGQCKYILGYVDGKLENAVYCGEDISTTITASGYAVKTSWCGFHKGICVTQDKRR